MAASFCLSKCSFATQISEAVGWVVTQCGTWKKEGKTHKYTIEVQFSYRKAAVHMRGWMGGFANLAVK